MAESLTNVLKSYQICINNCGEECSYYKYERNICKKWLNRDIIDYLEEYLIILPKEKIDKWIYWKNKYGKEMDD